MTIFTDSNAPTPRAFSDVLSDVQNGFKTKERVSIGELIDVFHERGMGFFLFLIALPAAWPFPGLGLHQIAGLPLILILGHMMLGVHALWLPERVKRGQFEWKYMDKLIAYAMPWVIKFENISRPRLPIMTQKPFSNVMGFIGILMSICIMVPFPFSNTLPGLCLAVIAIGLLMRDGLAVLLGTLVGGVWSITLITLMVIFGTEAFAMIERFLT